MAEGMGNGKPESIVRRTAKLHGLSSFEAEAATDENEGNIFKRVGVAFTELVGPDDGGVIKHRSLATRLWYGV